MLPAGNFDGAPGAGLGGLGTMQTLLMPADATGIPFHGVRGGSRLGAATAVDSPLYAAATLAGAGLGGALLGWVASDHREGAIKGAAFAAGLTSVSTGMATWYTQKGLGAVLVVGGLGGMLWAVRDRIKRRTR
jgi:hypothetical protein